MKKNWSSISYNKNNLWEPGDEQVYLTHLNPIIHFYTPWKRQKTFHFFMGYWNETLVCNGLIMCKKRRTKKVTLEQNAAGLTQKDQYIAQVLYGGINA